MNEDSVEILDEPPKPSSKCELRRAIWLLNRLKLVTPGWIFADQQMLNRVSCSVEG